MTGIIRFLGVVFLLLGLGCSSARLKSDIETQEEINLTVKAYDQGRRDTEKYIIEVLDYWEEQYLEMGDSCAIWALYDIGHSLLSD